MISKCFAYGRTYLLGRNHRDLMSPPWFQRTNSTNGGACNNSALPCYDMDALNVPRRYGSPKRLANLMNVGPGEWVVVQMYRFVIGRYSGSGYAWDCTDLDWRNHWTNKGELYCWTDYLYAIDRIPAEVVVTDPATVAEAWGRTPESLE